MTRETGTRCSRVAASTRHAFRAVHAQNADAAALLQRLALWLAMAVLACSAATADAITLDAALTRTAENNPAIQQAKAQLEAAAGRRLVLRSIALPDARIMTPGGVQGGQRAGEDQVQPFAFGRGALTQPLFNVGIPASYRRGNIELLLAQQRLNVAALEQLHTARVAFYTALYHQSVRLLAEQQLQRLEANVRTQSDRYQTGTAERGALNVARLLEQEVTPRIEDSRRIGNGALLRLAQTMGDDLGAGRELPTADGELRYTAADLDLESATATALANRADLKLARLLVRAAEEDQRIIEAAYYPSINATLSGDYIPVSEIRSGSEGSARRSDDIISSEVRAGVSYTWRVVDNGRVRGAAMRQRAAREINELVLARLEAEVPRELTRIQNNLRALATRQASLERASTVAEQTVTDVLNNLAQGLSSQLEYRTAESSYLQTKAGVLTVAFQQSLARAELDRVTGRYFQFSDDTKAKLH
jgi:outer membrane protein TolC